MVSVTIPAPAARLATTELALVRLDKAPARVCVWTSPAIRPTAAFVAPPVESDKAARLGSAPVVMVQVEATEPAEAVQVAGRPVGATEQEERIRAAAMAVVVLRRGEMAAASLPVSFPISKKAAQFLWP